MGDDSLLSILHSQYHLIEVNKTYLNQHLAKICLGSIKFFRHMEEKLKYENKYIRRGYLYFFTSKVTDPVKLSSKEVIKCYFNFRMLQVSNKTDNTSTNRTILELGSKRKALTDITNNVSPYECRESLNSDIAVHIITPPIAQKGIEIADLIGDYFVSEDAKTLYEIE